jgi:DNA-binding CsgD family transcriptional regulator
MDHLLVVASSKGIPESILQSLRLAGWGITVAADITSAKQLLQKRNVAGVIVDLSTNHDPERLKILRFVHEFCPNTMVMMLHSGMDAAAYPPGASLVETLDAMGDAGPRLQSDGTRDLHHLSPAQRRIAELVAQAFPNREIARKLKIKEQSVRNELSRIFRKMGIWNRVELALLMRKEEAPGTQSQTEPWKTEFGAASATTEVHKPATF